MPADGLPPITRRVFRPIEPITAAELLTLELPPRPMLLAPIVPAGGLALLYGPRGVGKTYLVLTVALAVACGGPALRWRAPEPRRVLVIDGEMPATMLQDRLRQIVIGYDLQPPADDYLKFLPADLFECGLPNIADEEGQRIISQHARDADLIILDNLSSLASGLRENEADDWTPMQAWLLALRRAGKAVAIVHHAGKAGQQRGTSRREDVMDTVVAIRRPGDYQPSQGARFEVHLEKARGLAGEAAAPILASLVELPNGGLTWATQDLAVSQRDRAADLLRDGLSIRDVAEETGLSKSAVHRLKKILADGGHGRH